MSKKIYLIRHGQTDFNKKGIVQGSKVDSDLNEIGKLQASLFYERYKDVSFDKVYTSALKRSIQSVQAFIDLGIPHEKYTGLNEISWGDMDGIQASYQSAQHYKEITLRWSNGEIDARLDNGESPLDVWKRQQPVIETIFSRSEEKTILICMHGRALRVLLSGMLHKDLAKMDMFIHENLGLYLLDYDGKNFQIIMENDQTHFMDHKFE